jgi:uncharacterized protein YndB with AHSA1/START domain
MKLEGSVLGGFERLRTRAQRVLVGSQLDDLIESEFTLQYFYGSTAESDWAPGSEYVREIDGQAAIVGEVLVAERPSRLSLTFDARWDDEVAPDPPSRVTWEIEPVGDGLSKLTVVHDGFDAKTSTYQRTAGGMPYILSGLKTLLETGEPLPAPVAAAV